METFYQDLQNSPCVVKYVFVILKTKLRKSSYSTHIKGYLNLDNTLELLREHLWKTLYQRDLFAEQSSLLVSVIHLINPVAIVLLVYRQSIVSWTFWIVSHRLNHNPGSFLVSRVLRAIHSMHSFPCWIAIVFAGKNSPNWSWQKISKSIKRWPIYGLFKTNFR